MLFKIGTLKKFEAKSRENCPYTRLYWWLLHKAYPMNKALYSKDNFYLPPNKEIDVRKVQINSKLDKELTKLVKKWIKYIEPYSSKDRVDKTFGWHHLCYGPSINDELEDGYIKICEGFIKDRNGKI